MCVRAEFQVAEASGSTEKPFAPLDRRFKLTPASAAVTSLKRGIIQVLLSACKVRANFRLAKLLEVFRAFNENPAQQRELIKLHLMVLKYMLA